MDRVIFYLGTMALAICSTYASLAMKPEFAILVILKGQTLTLECLHRYQGDKAPDITFKKDGAILTSNLQAKLKSIPGYTLQTYIYKKNVTLPDSGNYECVLDDTGETTSIKVFVFKTPECEDVKYMEGKYATLACDLAPSDKGAGLEYTVSWKHNNVTLKQDAKYSVVNNTLHFKIPECSRIEEYYPVFTFFPNSHVDRQTYELAPVAVKGLEVTCKGSPKSLNSGSVNSLNLLNLVGCVIGAVLYFKSPSSTTVVPYANILELDETPSNSASHPDSSCLTPR